MKNFLDVLKLLTRRERWQMGVILAFMLPNALMQVAGVASVMPFIAVMAQPELVQSNAVLSGIYNFVGAPPIQKFLAMLAGGALIMVVLSNGLAALTAWLILRFSYMRAHTFSRKLLGIYLAQPYGFFLLRNPSDLTKNITNEVNQLITGYLMPTLQLIANSIVVAALLVMLVAIDPMLAASVGLVLGGAYGAIYIYFRKRIRRMGQRRLAANARRFKASHEAFGAIKDIKVTGRENYYLNAYSDASYAFAHNQSNQEVIAQLPRYALETIAFGTILIIALYLTTGDRSIQGALPLIALYAMAGYRMMPALQKLFDNVTKLRFASPVVERMKVEMDLEGKASHPNRKSGSSQPEDTLALHDNLKLQNIVYRYPGTSAPVLNDISITIKARTSVAFVGESGAGKSTLVDIILGLLHPEGGSISVDGQELQSTTNRKQWQKHIGYVPQAIYLSDDTLRRNIALGIPEREIDDEAVIAAAKAASMHDFITTELPEGYNTVAGDRGIRLSGGQRQRIGIARALYNNPDLLILDEATSALDGATETAVMEAIERLSGEKTIIMIAHRLTTVKKCDCLYLMKRGRVVANGTYDELMQNQQDFRRMAHQAREPAHATGTA